MRAGRFSSGRRRAVALLAGVPAALALSARRARAQPGAVNTRPIPSSGERLPVVGLGTWQAFDVGDDAPARAALRATLSAFAGGGGRVVDSSPMYGTSESVLGDLAAELRIRDRLFVATKVWTSGRDEGIRQMELSLRRLRVERVDLMQVHNLVDADTHARTLAEWKQQGRIRYAGITHYSSSAYREIEARLRSGRWDFLQINYSLAEREAERRLLALAHERRVAVIVNRPFGEGAMFRRVRGKPLPAWAGEIGVASWAQYFLKWILGHPAVTCAIAGTGKSEHVRDNLGAAYGALPDEAMRARMAVHYDTL
jgi:diketogulonate reductase-like aldo/keto reductase